MKYEICKIHGENKFHEGDYRSHCRVAASFPLLLCPLNTVFGRSTEIRPAIEDRFQHGSGVINRDANSERQDEWKEPDLALPIFRMEFPLSTKIENGGRHCRRHKDREIEQEQTNYPACGKRARPSGRRVQQDTKTGQQQVSEIRGQVRRRFDLNI